jgi:D-alanyl-D-alanine carboxypeptidase
MCGLLRAIAAHPALGALRGCLPVLGRDGTLASVVPDSPAAGHVVAKTGTSTLSDRLERRAFVTAKGLAGYIDAASGEHLVFAAYVNNLALEPGETTGVPGTLLGRIAATAYDLF